MPRRPTVGQRDRRGPRPVSRVQVSTPTDPSVVRAPTVRIRPRHGWRLPDLGELWRYRELLLAFSRRELTVRYRQTIVGSAWIVIGPLLSAGIFSFVFGRVAGLPSDGIPYFAFSFGGLLAWNAFSAVVNRTSGVMLSYGSMISKVYVPKLLLPVSTLTGTLVNFVVGLGAMAVLMIAYGIAPTPRLVLLPVWILLIVMLAMSLGLVLSAFAVHFRDVNFITPVLISLLLYVSPVAYAASAVPEQYANLYMMNPLTGLLQGFRWSLFGQGDLVLWATFSAVALTLILLCAGALVFTRMEHAFPDVI